MSQLNAGVPERGQIQIINFISFLFYAFLRTSNLQAKTELLKVISLWLYCNILCLKYYNNDLQNAENGL